MFSSKQKNLIEKKAATAVIGSKNAFVQAASKAAATVLSGNGALKYSSTGNDFVDQFGQAGNYKKPRDYASVQRDMSVLWGISPKMALAFAFYLRTVTRIVSLFSGDKTANVQRGQGLKHEGIFRMMWVAINHPNVFWKNVHLFISVGSWKDIITMLSYDLQYNGWKDRKLDWDKFGQLILAGLENPKQSNLLKKYLPQIKANSRCNTLEAQADNLIAKWICSLIFGTKESSYNYKKYRQLKTSGTAHEWQKLISSKNLVNINFNTIHGRALSLLVSSKFLKNNGLEKRYEDWIATQPLAKYTGYVYELFQKLTTSSSKAQVETLNKQFMSLVETAKKGAKGNTSLIVVRDTSSSMGAPAVGTKVSCYNVAKSLALFFSHMLPEGHFANSWIEFNSTAKFHNWKGATPVDKWRNDSSSYVGSTDFQSVIRLLCEIKVKKGVAESEFPTGILCISDGEFNPSQLGKTNVQTARNTLKQAGFSAEYCKNFQIILWNVGNNYYGRTSGNTFETHGEAENTFYFSGLDGSTIAFLTGLEANKPAPKTDVELFEAAMDQEILNMLEV